MAPVNKGSDKRKHKSLSISEKVELLKKLDEVVNVGYMEIISWQRERKRERMVNVGYTRKIITVSLNLNLFDNFT